MENEKREKRVSFRPRLSEAAKWLSGFSTIADIGCDHGRLSIGLLQRGMVSRAIATEISAPSLEKAKQLALYTGVAHNMDFRVGDGLMPLYEGEADAIAILGMGGALIAQILAEREPPLLGAKRVVMQPMRGVEELRRYLRENGYRITADSIVMESGRYYQVFAAERGEEEEYSALWPKDFYALGYHARTHPLFKELAKAMLLQYEKRLSGARCTRGEYALAEKIEKLKQALRALNTHPQ